MLKKIIRCRGKFMKSTLFFSRHKKVWAFLVVVGLCGVGGGIYHYWSSRASLEWGKLDKAPDEVIGEKVVLRLLHERYFIDYHNAWSRDVRQGLEFPEDIDLDYTIRFLRYELENFNKGKQITYCVFEAQSNVLVGAVDIREKTPTSMGQFGWWLNEKYRGKGLIQEAAKLIANVYFRLYDVDSFEVHVRLWNKRSYYALVKAGFVDTGTFFYEDGKPARHILNYYRPK